MDTFSKIIAVLFGAFIVFMLYRYIRANPESLSRENLGKSFYSMGLLGVGLIIFITVLIFLLRR
jgi:hypothetical protein